MVPVTRENKSGGNDMMCEHLCVVFPSLLNVDHDHLLQPKCELHQVVPLEKPTQLPSRPMSPQVA